MDDKKEFDELFEDLKKHDWYYEMSDDHNTWRRGKQNYTKLVAKANKIIYGIDLMLAFRDYYFSGNAWGTPKTKHPEDVYKQLLVKHFVN